LTELCGRIEPARVAYSCSHKAVNHGGNWARGVSAVSVFHKRVQDSHPPWRRASTEDDVPWVQIYRRLIVGGIVIGSFGHKPFLNYLCRGDKGQTSAIPTCVIYVGPDRKLSRGRLRKFKLDLAVAVCHEDQLFPVKAETEICCFGIGLPFVTSTTRILTVWTEQVVLTHTKSNETRHQGEHQRVKLTGT